MVRVLIAGLAAMVLAVVLGPTFIDWLRRSGVGQQIREEGPARHIVKQGTPTMGGLLILATAVLPFLVLSLHTFSQFENTDLGGVSLRLVTGAAEPSVVGGWLRLRVDAKFEAK